MGTSTTEPRRWPRSAPRPSPARTASRSPSGSRLWGPLLALALLGGACSGDGSLEPTTLGDGGLRGDAAGRLPDGALLRTDGALPDDAGPFGPPSCGGGASFIADHLVVPATGPHARELGIARFRLVVADWEGHHAIRAAGFDAKGLLVVEGQWALDAATLAALDDSASEAAILAAMTHVFESVEGTPLGPEDEEALWLELADYLAATPCVLELEPWVPFGETRASLSTERGASARCEEQSVASFREWLRVFPRLVRSGLRGTLLRDLPAVLAGPFRRAAELNCCAGSNTPWLGVTGCTCSERFGAAFPVRREYPDPSGGFGAEHVCEACPADLEWSERHRRCAEPLDDPPPPEIGACPAAGADIDYPALRSRLEGLAAESPFVTLVEVEGASGGICAPLQRTPLYVPCDATEGVPFLARPAGGAIDTNPTAGLLGPTQWLWHVSYAVLGMLDRGLVDPGDGDGTSTLYSSGFAEGTPAVTVCDRAMAAGPFGGRAIANPIIAFPDRVVSEEERIAAGLDASREWCADTLVTKFSTSLLRCNAHRIRGSNFLLLFPETPTCGGERPPEGVDGAESAAALCMCPLDAPNWDPVTRSCQCVEEDEVWDPEAMRCRPEERCFGALGTQCTPLQRDPTFTGILPVSCGVDHVGRAPPGTLCTTDPFFREVTDLSGRPRQWQSVGVGSLLHDQCCREHPEGFFCGEHGSLFGACRSEFNQAVADFLGEGTLWAYPFDPAEVTASDIFVGGDHGSGVLTDYGRRLQAGVGARVREEHAWVCTSGSTWQGSRCETECAPSIERATRDTGDVDEPLPYESARPVYPQSTESACGAAAVAMVLEDAAVMDEIVDTCALHDGTGGTTALELARELRERGRLYSPVQLTDLDALAAIVDESGEPAVALIEDDDERRHWVVLDGVVYVDDRAIGECGTLSVAVRDSQAPGASYLWSLDGLWEAYAGVALIPGPVLDDDGSELPIDEPRAGPFETRWGTVVDGIAGPLRGAGNQSPQLVPNPLRDVPIRNWGTPYYALIRWDDLVRWVGSQGGLQVRFKPDSHHSRGFRYVWTLADGRKVLVWGHGPTNRTDLDEMSNARTGPIVRIQVQNRLVSYISRGFLRNKNEQYANETHIPLVDCPLAYCYPVPEP